MVAMLTMSANLTTLDLLKIKVFWNKGYDVLISVHVITNEILSRHSNYILGVVIWQKFGNSRISGREVIRISTEKNYFFEWCSWFKFNNLELALDLVINLISKKGFKLKVRIIGLSIDYRCLQNCTWKILQLLSGYIPYHDLSKKRNYNAGSIKVLLTRFTYTVGKT